MKLFKKLKKGFTLVELIVVIAVIAVLAATSIGVYFGVTESAKKSNDLSVITQMNKALKIDEAVNGAPNAPSGALDVLRNYGFDVTKMTPYQDGAYYLWDSKENQLVLLNKDNTVDAPVDAEVRIDEKYEYYGFANSMNEIRDGYSYHLNDNFSLNHDEVLEFSTSIDTGTNAVNILLKNVIDHEIDVFTNGGSVTVQDPNAEVNHYGTVQTLKIDNVANDSYHLKGNVTMLLEINKGRIVIESTANVQEIDVLSEEAIVEFEKGSNTEKLVVLNNFASLDIENGATIDTVIAKANFVPEVQNSLSLSRSAPRNVIEIVEVGSGQDNQESKLRSYLADPVSYPYILLNNDITINKNLVVKPGTTIDGAGHKIYAAKDSEGVGKVFPTVINLKGTGEDAITFKNLYIDGSNLGERGEAIILSSPNLNVNISKCTIEATYYTLVLSGTRGAHNANINIDSTTIIGWSPIDVGSTGNVFNFNRCTIIGINDYLEYDPVTNEKNSAEWATIIFERNSSKQVLNINNSVVETRITGDFKHYVVAFVGGPEHYVEFARCNIYFSNKTNEYFYGNFDSNSIVIDGVSVNANYRG